ncbi:MAG: hypothetical protein GY940_19655 [bacterium]|nr:hypothetical protein [bacterium]
MTEKKEPPKTPDYDLGDDELGLEKYIKPKRYQTKFWLWVILLVILFLLAYIYKTTIIDKTIPVDQLKAAMKIFNINSHWVENEKVDTPDFKGVIVVPEISFQVRNVGTVDLHYVYILGVFRLLDQSKVLGDDYQTAFKDALKPGQESKIIRLRCKFGYRVTSKQALNKQSKDWRSAMVELFVKSGTSGLSSLKSFYISRKIEGLDIEIKVTDKPVEEIREEMGEKSKE